MLRVALVCAPLIVLFSFVFRDANRNSPAGLQPRPGNDSRLTEEFRLLEQQLDEAAVHRDTKLLERLVGSDYMLRVGDAPEESFPRAPWMDSLRPESPYPWRVESFYEQYHAARRLTDNLAVVSLLLTQKATNSGRDRSGDFYLVDIWKKAGDNWQIIARYSTATVKNR